MAVIPGQKQRPVLNDALNYLDQVKSKCANQPGVYQRLLDIMKDFKNQEIDIPMVIEQVGTLLAGHSELVQGFDAFLPPGHQMKSSASGKPNKETPKL